ncbi:phosphoribosylformylglycinamidine synthase subunit PurS [Desulfovibrio sp. OttesenSCG-928-G15]|nr:phosphoribosylformylglycinamidine synthase subunit PurS [Desulfovibrio sp. OttesenSCG-928-G15]
MLQSLEVRLKPNLDDCVGRNFAAQVKASLGLDVASARVGKAYIVDGLDESELALALERSALHDPVLQDASLTPFASDADWIIEVGFRPGVTDNEGRTAKETLAMVLGKKGAATANMAVYTATRYHMRTNLKKPEVERIAKDLLANELIQRYSIKSGEEWRAAPGFAAQAAKVTGAASSDVRIIPLSTMDDEALVALSRDNTWALSLEEMHAVKAYFALPETVAGRKEYGLGADPTDAEMEVLAQTWSEHCKHKIFAALIAYENTETGRREQVNSLYKSYIQGATAKLRKRMGDKDFCRSVFKDNAGVVAFNDTHDVCIKVETHNSPSALDPYGGALTGIVGVNRDPMGTGLGAELVCNTDVFCFASPFYEGELPPRLLHPRRVMEGVRLGVEDGGNKSGIPTVNGSIVFDERYLGKPLVYCGTVGMMPTTIHGKPGHYKKANPGDVIVMAGGRIGKDGIHGATFSSEELHEGSPATAVQIGDPITQRKLYDCIIRARNLGLYTAITDNGAGGLSSSVGEMAEDTGGCLMDLAKAPLKYDGLRPWEILLSEAQERMTLAVPQDKLEAFLGLAAEMDVEATALGQYTDSGYFHVCYGDTVVTHLPMDFMHDGVPQMRLAAKWERPGAQDDAAGLETASASADHSALLHSMLGRLNICSKEYLIRQYDHEVKGGSVVKPLVGVKRDGPGDAAVMRPLLDDEAGIVLSHGICPKFSDADTYWMMANAIDEAVRNAVAVGADPERLAGVDNFCWCDPVYSEKTPDGHYKLAQLVRSGKALEHFCLGFGVPCVSGKDSMKNDYTGGGTKISIPPTVLFSILGHIPDVNRAMTSDWKEVGDVVYILGVTARELAGSEIASELGLALDGVPHVDLVAARSRYALVYQAIRSGIINACHDLSDGGLAVALAEMALGGRLGARITLEAVPCVGLGSGAAALMTLLYSESASRLLVTVPRDKVAGFEALLTPASGCLLGSNVARIGEVTADGTLTLVHGETLVASASAETLGQAFKGTFAW